MTTAPQELLIVGVPLRTPEGYNVGSLCMDIPPRHLGEADIAILANFASIVCDELQLRQVGKVDHLTGALTCRDFVEHTKGEIARPRPPEETVADQVVDRKSFRITIDW